MADKDKNDNQNVKFTDIDPETLPDEVKPIYKSMLADYTRKTQTLAEEKKTFAEREDKWKEELKAAGAMEQELKQWRDWYNGLGDSDDTNDDPLQDLFSVSSDDKGGDDRGGKDTPDAGDDKGAPLDQRYLAAMTALQDRVKQLEGQIAGVADGVNKSRKQTDRMFVYQDQLVGLQAKYGTEIDKKAILDHALKEGYTDLEKAYRDLHQEDLIQAEVDRRVAEEAKKLRAGAAVQGGKQVVVKTRTDRPKTYEEATEAALRDIGGAV